MPRLTCPSCGSEHHADDQQSVTTCPTCEKAFFVSDGIAATSQADQSAAKSKRKRKAYQEFPQPRNMQVYETDKELVFTWNWWGCSSIFIIIFTVIWNGIIWAVFLPPALAGDWNMLPPVPLCFLIPGMHILVGLGLLYGSLSIIFNRTTVSVSGNKIITQTRPFPTWRSNNEFYADDIEQLYVKRNVHRSKNGTHYSYDVMVVAPDSAKPKRLLQSLQRAEYALYLEQEIETYLGIADRPVPEEYKK